MIRHPPRSPLFPYPPLSRSVLCPCPPLRPSLRLLGPPGPAWACLGLPGTKHAWSLPDRKSTCLNSSHLVISYAVFCLKKKKDRIKITLYHPFINVKSSISYT